MAFARRHYWLVLILIFSSIVFSTDLDKPFIGHHDWNGTQHSNFARNIVRYGLLQYKFKTILSNDPNVSSDVRYSIHYPPLLPILIASSFKIFGIHEWSARLVPLLFSLGTITMIYLLGYKFFSPKVAILAAAFSTILPIVVYFGKMPVHEPIILPLALLAIYFYFAFFENSNWVNFLKLFSILVLAHLVNWPAYYLSFIFFIHYLILKKKLRIALIFPLISITMFLLFILNAILLYTPERVIVNLADIFLDRLSITDIPQEYSFVTFLKLQIRFVIIYFTKIPLIFLLITVFWIIFEIGNKRITKEIQLLLILGIFGIAHNLIFRNAAFIHDYLIFYLVPFIVLTSAKGFFLIVENLHLSKLHTLLLSTILIILITKEGLPFTRALIESSAFEEGVSMGKIINQSIPSGQKALILSPEFKQYFEVFTLYYADRPIDYEVPTAENLKNYLFSQRYSLVIAIPSRDTPKELVEILLQNRIKATQIDKFLVFSF